MTSNAPEVIDLLDSDDEDGAVEVALARPNDNRPGGAARKKRKAQPTEEVAATFSDGEVEAAFSDGGEEEVSAPEVADSADADGYDLSGSCVADASMSECPLCGTAFQVAWDPDIRSLVNPGTVMLRHQIYHADCIARRRGPIEEGKSVSRRPTPPPTAY